MKKYAKIINEETKQCEVAIGINTLFYKSIGMVEMDVKQAYDGRWFVEGYAPEKPEPTYDEQKEARAEAYRQEKDPITCHIQSLRDEEQTPEIQQEIADLIQERAEIVENIKARYPYPEEESES